MIAVAAKSVFDLRQPILREREDATYVLTRNISKLR